MAVVTIKNNFGNKASFCEYGAIIMEFHIVNAKGATQDIVLGFDTEEAYQSEYYKASNPHFGAIVGPVANRIGGAKYTLNGKTYHLEANLAPNHLHGGAAGWSVVPWKLKTVHHDAEEPYVIFELIANNDTLNNGYTGVVTAKVKYTLAQNNLITEITATTTADTLINPTQHTYFNLNIDGATIENHRVIINGDSILEQDESCCPTGNIIPIQGTRFNLADKQNFTTSIERYNGYDHTYVLPDNKGALSFAAECSVPDSGTVLQVWTTAPCIHFYTGPYIPALTGKGGAAYGKNSGLCFETQIHPDAINHANFPSIVLKPTDTFHHRSEYRLLNK